MEERIENPENMEQADPVGQPDPVEAEQEISLDIIYDKIAGLSGNFYKTLFLICSVLAFFVMPILSFDAGITDDERLHQEHGTRIMNYYLHGDTLATTTPFDPQGHWRIKAEPFNYVALLNIYGGFFDLVAAVIYRGITHHLMGEYESKHMLSSFTGWGLLLLIGLMAYRLTGSWAAALLGFLFAAASPRIIGHSLSNPKDIPFALAFGIGIYQILRVLQEDLRLGWQRIAWLIIIFIIAIDTRVGGVILLFQLVMFVGIYILDRLYFGQQPWRLYVRPALIVTGICIVSYFGSSLFWPFAGKNPLLNPIRCLNVFSTFNDFSSYELFEGRRIGPTEIPWYFVPKWFYISFPPVVFFGFIIFPLFLWRICEGSRSRMLQYGLIIFSIAFPIASVIIKKSNLYDDARHLFFLLPSTIALASLGWYFLFKSMSDRRILYPVTALFSVLLISPYAFMVRSHPMEALYFSPLIGGEQGAFRNYEMDYWGVSLRPALRWIEQTDSVQAHGRKTRVRMWYGEQMKIKYYCDKSKITEYIACQYQSPDWDYTLMMPVESKNIPDLMNHWPPSNTVHEIILDGTPVCAIVRNPQSTIGTDAAASAQQAPAPQAAVPVAPGDAGGHIAAGLQFYTAKDFNKAAIEFKKALLIDSSSQMAYNDLVATYNNLQMFSDAVELGARALVKFPNFDLLKNNLALSKDGLRKLKISESYLAALSFNYYSQGDYAKCVNASMMILKLNPNSTGAYNNMCASYNAMGNFKLGKEACEKGLRLAPQEQLLKNNLKVSTNGLGNK